MKKLIYGMFAIILGIGLSAANVSATSYDPTGAAGEKPCPPSTPMILNHAMVGDALLGEVYRAVVDDTIGGESPINFVTYVSIENTSSKWVAAHVRLRTGRFSIEVIDFPILLSPYDVFWFQFNAIASDDPHVPGQPKAIKLWSMDENTIEKSGLDTFSGSTYEVNAEGNMVWTLELASTILDEFDVLLDEYKMIKELTQGYIEVFGLFAIDAIDDDANFYNVMGDLWTDNTGVGNRPSHDGNAAFDVGKFLTGHVFMGDFNNGLYTGYTMKAIKDFRTSVVQGSTAAGIDRRDFFIRGTTNGGTPALEIDPATILYKYPKGLGTDTAYTEPDWATSFGPTWNDGTNTFGTPVSAVDSFSLDEVDDAVVKQQLSGTFFNSAWTGETYSVAIVTAFTKYLHFLYDENSGIDFDTDLVNNMWPVGDGSKAYSVRQDLDVEDAIGSLGLKGAVWNLAEKTPLGHSPFDSTMLDWEVTMIPMGIGSRDALADFCFLVLTDGGSPFVKNVTTELYPAGMFIMRNFSLQGGVCGGDPRSDAMINSSEGYVRSNFGLLGVLDQDIIPVSGMMMDFDFKNFPHARMYNMSWDNPIIPD